MSRLVPPGSSAEPGTPPEIDEMARACFEEEVEERVAAKKKEIDDNWLADLPWFGWTFGLWVCAVGALAVVSQVTSVVGFALGAVIVVAGMFYALYLGPRRIAWALRSGRRQRDVRKEKAQAIAAYAAHEPWAIQQVHEFAVREFRRRIAEHRDGSLGADSEWARARTSLAEAADEAQRSAAYWRARLGTNPDSELAGLQSRRANRLESKLKRAVEKADGRAEALRRFYNDCEAKLAVMDRSNQDLAESRRLDVLSDRADVVMAAAGESIELLARKFVAEAQTIAASISGAAEVGVKSLAGEAPLDNIEYLADAVIENSERERSTIEELERRLNEA